eukprot:EG_transcript_5421
MGRRDWLEWRKKVADQENQRVRQRRARRKKRKAEAKVEARLAKQPIDSATLKEEISGQLRSKKQPKGMTPLHAEANDLFRSGQHEEALERYTQALAEGADERLLSNRAACYIALGRFEEAVKDADAAIKLKRNFFKAHYRRACAMQGLENMKEVRASMRRAARYSSSHPFFRTLLADLRSKWLDDKEKPAGPYARLAKPPKKSKEELQVVEESVKRQRPNALGGHVLMVGDTTYSVTMRSLDEQQVVEMHVQTVGTSGNCLLQINTGARMPKRYKYVVRDERTRVRHLKQDAAQAREGRRSELQARVAAFDPFVEEEEEPAAATPQEKSAAGPAEGAPAAAQPTESSGRRTASLGKRKGGLSTDADAGPAPKRKKGPTKAATPIFSQPPTDPQTGQRVIPKPLPRTFAQRKEAKLKALKKKYGKKFDPRKHERKVRPDLRYPKLQRELEANNLPTPRWARYKPRDAKQRQFTQTGQRLSWQPEREIRFVYGQVETKLLPQAEAIATFEQLFHEKTGVRWASRHRCRYNPKYDVYFFPNEMKVEATR